jgi:predicted flap endonuclease-1-like 5' DNA nuclease
MHQKCVLRRGSRDVLMTASEAKSVGEDPMRCRIEDIEGIGPVYGLKSSKVGISSTDRLFEHCGSAKGRRQLASTSGLDEGQLLQWANMADLMRIRGIGKQFAEPLETAGVDTVKELRTRRADKLAAKMKEANAKKKLTRATPSERQIAAWINQARSMSPLINY